MRGGGVGEEWVSWWGVGEIVRSVEVGEELGSW